MQIDSYTGELLDTVDDLGIAKNTIFIFTADNGPEALEVGGTSLTVEEPVETYNLSMMGLLAKIGVRKGEPFKPSAELQAIHAKAAPEALEYMIEVPT